VTEAQDQNAKIHMLPRGAYPVTIRIMSCKGHEIWHKVIQKPPKGVATIKIPGYGGTEHAPVKVFIKYADDTDVEVG
jgi:hypothetical protein